MQKRFIISILFLALGLSEPLKSFTLTGALSSLNNYACTAGQYAASGSKIIENALKKCESGGSLKHAVNAVGYSLQTGRSIAGYGLYLGSYGLGTALNVANKIEKSFWSHFAKPLAKVFCIMLVLHYTSNIPLETMIPPGLQSLLIPLFNIVKPGLEATGNAGLEQFNAAANVIIEKLYLNPAIEGIHTAIRGLVTTVHSLYNAFGPCSCNIPFVDEIKEVAVPVVNEYVTPVAQNLANQFAEQSAYFSAQAARSASNAAATQTAFALAGGEQMVCSIIP